MHTSEFRPLDVETYPRRFSDLRNGTTVGFPWITPRQRRPRVPLLKRWMPITIRIALTSTAVSIGFQKRQRHSMNAAREKVAQLVNAPRARQIIFTRNTTESINLVAYSWGSANIREGDEIVLTVMEHHSNLVPWQLLAQRTGAVLRFLEITDEGLLDFTQLQDLLTEKTKLVAMGHVSNVLGTINPIQSVITAAHAVGCKRSSWMPHNRYRIFRLMFNNWIVISWRSLDTKCVVRRVSVSYTANWNCLRRCLLFSVAVQ